MGSYIVGGSFSGQAELGHLLQSTQTWPTVIRGGAMLDGYTVYPVIAMLVCRPFRSYSYKPESTNYARFVSY